MSQNHQILEVDIMLGEIEAIASDIREVPKNESTLLSTWTTELSLESDKEAAMLKVETAFLNTLIELL